MTDPIIRSWPDRLIDTAAVLVIMVGVVCACAVYAVRNLEGLVLTTPQGCADLVAVSPVWNHEAIIEDEKRTGGVKRR